MSSPHATSHHNIVALQLTLGIRQDNNAEIVGEQVHGVVSRYSDGNLELPGQELGAIDWLRGPNEVGAKCIVVAGLCHLWTLQHNCN